MELLNKFSTLGPVKFGGGRPDVLRSLFNAGEPGVLFDFSPDVAGTAKYLYTTSAGTTLATPGDPVGLALDRHEGLTLGPELVANGGGPFTSATGWTASGGTLAVVDGALVLTASAAGTAYITATFSNAGGKSYRAAASYSGAGANINTYRTGAFTGFMFNIPNGSTVLGLSNDTDTTASVTMFFSAGAAGETITLNSITIRELPGNHAVQETAAARPTYGIVPEGGRRNLLTHTEQFDNAAWGKTGSPTIGAGADLGGYTSQRLTATGNVDTKIEQPGLAVVSGLQYTFRTRLAKVSGSGWVFLFFNGGFSDSATWFDLTNGVTGTVGANATALIEDAGDHYICSITATALSTGLTGARIEPCTGNVASVAATGDAVDIAAVQLETGSTASAYQKVTTAFNVTEAGRKTLGYLSLDGVDDSMVTPTITPGTDKVQVFAGVRKLSDAATSAILEHSVNPDSNNGCFSLANVVTSGNAFWRSKGTNPADVNTAAALAPVTRLHTGLGDISGDRATLRINGAQVGAATGDQGTGNYLAYPLYIGSRGGTGLRFNGHLFSLACRFGPNLDAATIAKAEKATADKTAGVTL